MESSRIEYHGGATRSGLFVEPTFTKGAMSTLHRDSTFGGSFTGSVHAQPLYMSNGPGGRPTLIVATMSNDLIAFDAANGGVLGARNFGPAVDQTTTDCVRGNYPLGIFGTPLIDMQRRVIYFDTAIGAEPIAGVRYLDKHLVHAVSVDSGVEQSGWPIDVSGVKANGQTFEPALQSQRGALTMLGDTLYVPYGSVADCGAYHGWLIAITVDAPSQLTAWATPGRGGGIWSAGGAASDGASIFVVTGNGTTASGEWAGQNAVLRFGPGPLAQPADVFAPAAWPELDAADNDLGGTNPTLVDLPTGNPTRLLVALGKNGYAYLLDRDRLGGISEGDSNIVTEQQVMTSGLSSSAAAYRVGNTVYLVTDGQSGGVGTHCPDGQAGDLVAVRIAAGAPPTLDTAWCQDNHGHGAPIVTVTAEGADPIVWVTGANGDGRLRGYDGVTGEVVFDGGSDDDTLDPARLHRFSSLLAVGGRLVVAEDNQLVVFTS